MAEYALKLLELYGSQVRHVARDQLIFEKCEFLGYAGANERELVGQLVVGVGRKVVLFDVGFGALRVDLRDGG